MRAQKLRTSCWLANNQRTQTADGLSRSYALLALRLLSFLSLACALLSELLWAIVKFREDMIHPDEGQPANSEPAGGEDLVQCWSSALTCWTRGEGGGVDELKVRKEKLEEEKL